jgi:hypothetical protein
MIGILKINTREYLPRIYPFKYWYELHNVRIILRTKYSAVIFTGRSVNRENHLSDSGRGLGLVTCNLMIRQVVFITTV